MVAITSPAANVGNYTRLTMCFDSDMNKSITNGIRHCIHCDTDKPLSEFYGYRKVCRPCLVVQQRERRAGRQHRELAQLLHRWPRITT